MSTKTMRVYRLHGVKLIVEPTGLHLWDEEGGVTPLAWSASDYIQRLLDVAGSPELVEGLKKALADSLRRAAAAKAPALTTVVVEGYW